MSAVRPEYAAAVLADALEERGFDPVVHALAVAELCRRGDAPRDAPARLVAALLANDNALLREVAILTRGAHECTLRALSSDSLGGVRSPTMVQKEYATYLRIDGKPSYRLFSSYEEAEQVLIDQHAHLSVVIVGAAR